MAQSSSPAKKKDKWYEALAKDFLTGGVSAAISKTINAPFERVKLLLQTKTGNYTSVWNCLRRLPVEDGALAYWRGNFANVIRYFPTQAMNFAFKDFYKNLFMPKGQKNYSYWDAFWRNLLSGGGAGATSLIVVYPLDLARTRMSTDKGKGESRTYTGLGDCVKKTWKEGGIRALYKGFNISVAGIIPYRAVYFGGYDTLKMIFFKEDKKVSFWFKWLISQTNTIFAQFLTYPIDTVRRVMMLAGEKRKDGTVNPTYRSSFHCASVIIKERGFTGMFKGAMANTYRATGAALCMVFYDSFKEKFQL